MQAGLERTSGRNYGWFLRPIGGQDAGYAQGYGGQMLYVIPGAGLTVAITSDDTAPAGRSGYRDRLHELTAEIIQAASSEKPRSGAGHTAAAQ